jgi:hypothetical protein
MASAPSTHVFARGSRVLDYWLARAEGFTVQPLGARVEEVVVAHPTGEAEALIVRSRRTRRRRAIDAGAIAAVDPSRQQLLLAGPSRSQRAREAAGRRARTTAAGLRSAGRRTATGGSSAAAWTRPRASAAAQTSARGGRAALAWTLAAIAWLRPRLVAATSRGLAAAHRATETAWRESRAFAARQRELIGTRWPPPPEPPSDDASTRISHAPERKAPKNVGRTQPKSTT